MMKIGVVIGRIGGLDGVALETEKWLCVLRELGHDIFILSGETEGKLNFHTEILSLLSFTHPQCIKEQQEVFFAPTQSEESVQKEVLLYACEIEKQITSWLITKKIELMLIENASALPFHLSMGIALFQVLQKTKIPSIAHDHDFYWERGLRYHTNFPAIEKLIKQCFPPVLENLKHVVISSFAQQYLFEKFKISAHIIPNVMDFEKPFAQADPYNTDLRKNLGINQQDIVFCQITRMVRRKGIETALELVQRLRNPRIKLLITGSDEDESTDGSYLVELQKSAQSKKISDQVLFASDFFALRRQTRNHKKIYSLEDAYFLADAITYFSSYEGFGNAFVETVLAKKPIFVNNYQPVYWPDIGSKGFRTVQIENGALDEKALICIESLLQDTQKIKEMTEINFELGKRYFSFVVLKKLLRKILLDFS